MKKILALILTFVLCLILTGCGVVDYFNKADAPKLKNGFDHYLRDGGREDSSFGIIHFVLYSQDFVTEHQYIEGDYNYYVNGSADPWFDTSDFYECCVFEFRYDPSEYVAAKQDLFTNSSYSSDKPTYQHNGFDFYVLTCYEDQEDYFFAHSFNDKTNEIILLACYAKDDNSLSDILNRGGTWLVFLDMYFGEFYDFNE